MNFQIFIKSLLLAALTLACNFASAESISLSCEMSSKSRGYYSKSILIDLKGETMVYSDEVYTIFRASDSLIYAEADHPAGRQVAWILEIDRVTGGVRLGTRTGNDKQYVVSGMCKRATAKF